MRRATHMAPCIALDSLPRIEREPMRSHRGASVLNVTADRQDVSRAPLRDHVATSVRRYLRELEIPLFAEVLRHCDGNQSRAAAMLGIHRATLRKKLKDYGLSS